MFIAKLHMYANDTWSSAGAGTAGRLAPWIHAQQLRLEQLDISSQTFAGTDRDVPEECKVPHSCHNLIFSCRGILLLTRCPIKLAISSKPFVSSIECGQREHYISICLFVQGRADDSGGLVYENPPLAYCGILFG